MRPKAPTSLFPPDGRPLRLLLVRLSALGDVLHALPTLAALRQRLPQATLNWVVEDRAAGLLAGQPDLNRAVVFPRRQLSAGGPLARGRALRGFLGDLRTESYDAVLDLQGNLKSGLIARSARSTWRYGWDRQSSREGNHLFHQRRVFPPPGTPSKVELNLALAGAVLGEPLHYVAPRLPVSDSARLQAHDLLRQAGLPERGAVLLHPGTSGFGSFKRWPVERYAALARRLLNQGQAVGITYGPAEYDLAQELARASGGRARPLGPESLSILTELLRGARLVVGGDTGPVHLAALLGTPVVAIFGPKDPRIYGPYGRRADGRAGLLDVVVQEGVACRPCTLRRCAAPLCLTQLDPDRVSERVQRVLAATG